jgi:outer membrane lipopolysaccharide assembly protein LptE/RlpB
VKNLIIIIAVMLLTSVAGCGYRAAGWSSSPHAEAGKTMNIPLFINRTYKPNLEGVLANALIDEFAAKRGISIQASEGELTLSGQVLSYGYAATAYSGADTVEEYTSSMTVSATLRRNSNQQVLWKGTLSWSQAFPSNSDIALQQNAEEAAISEICTRLAQQLYLNLAGGDF